MKRNICCAAMVVMAAGVSTRAEAQTIELEGAVGGGALARPAVRIGVILGDFVSLGVGVHVYFHDTGPDDSVGYFELSALRWASSPLRGNLGSFLLFDRVLISGYGFTSEDDFLYVTDAVTGAHLQSIALDSGPRLMVVHEGRLYVRAYDRNYIFSLNGPVGPAEPAHLEPSGPRRAGVAFPGCEPRRSPLAAPWPA